MMPWCCELHHIIDTVIHFYYKQDTIIILIIILPQREQTPTPEGVKNMT